MSSSCCGTKKQRMNNQNCNHTQVNHAKTNGHSSGSSDKSAHNHSTNHHHATNHNGVCSNGYDGVEQVASAEMCFFCFETLHRELFRVDDQPEANFTNDA